jgi:GH24 family phage-related lysozyme (muramidase)
LNKYLDGAVVLTSICSVGLATISIAESKIQRPAERFVKDIQLQRLNDSLSINLEIELNNSRPKPSPQSVPQPVSDTAVNFIKKFEGFKGHAYIDTDGTPVIGYGLSKIAGKPVRLGDRITTDRAEAALKEHLQEIDKELSQILKVNLSDRQKSALVSIAFNVGINAIKNSTLLRKINAKDFAGAANEFLRWDKANVRGRLVQMPGLARRRTAERELFLHRSS